MHANALNFKELTRGQSGGLILWVGQEGRNKDLEASINVVATEEGR